MTKTVKVCSTHFHEWSHHHFFIQRMNTFMTIPSSQSPDSTPFSFQFPDFHRLNAQAPISYTHPFHTTFNFQSFMSYEAKNRITGRFKKRVNIRCGNLLLYFLMCILICVCFYKCELFSSSIISEKIIMIFFTFLYIILLHSYTCKYIGFLLSIFQKLVEKDVWKWQICCNMTTNHA